MNKIKERKNKTKITKENKQKIKLKNRKSVLGQHARPIIQLNLIIQKTIKRRDSTLRSIKNNDINPLYILLIFLLYNKLFSQEQKGKQ